MKRPSRSAGHPMLRQSILVLLISIAAGLLANALSPNGIPVVEEYFQIDLDRATPVVPPDAEVGDPPFIALDLAVLDHHTDGAIFVDARSLEEFECGTIPGSINIPFEYMPEVDDLGPYFDSALGYTPKDTRLIVFCSGEDCDLSLHLARNLQAYEYTDIAIFFGGSREWEKWGPGLERMAECDE